MLDLLSWQFSIGVATQQVTDGQTATSGDDYKYFEEELKFYPGIWSKNIELEIIDDIVPEGVESFVVVLSPASSESCSISSTASTRVDIYDNEGTGSDGNYVSNIV